MTEMTEMNMYKNYDTTIENAKTYIAKHGVCVIPNILSGDECKLYINSMWNTLEYLTEKSECKITRDDTSTWKNFKKLYPIHSMLLQYYKIGHSQFVWNLRQNEKIVNVFSKLWDTPNDELLSSFDGLSIHMPPEITNSGYYRSNKWLHIDQSYNKPGLKCIQGFITLFDVNAGDATLKIMENSHKYHSEFSDKFTYAKTKYNKDWCKLTSDELDWYSDEKKCEEHNILASAGSLVLWDSRTIHQGMEPLKTRPKSNMRGIVYMCMTPRRWSTEAQINKKRETFNNMRMTSHWPHVIKLVGQNPHTYGSPLPDNLQTFPKPILTPLGEKLAGF